MNVSEIQTWVKRQFGDESGVQITDADIIRWINSGQREIVRDNEGLLEKVGLANAVAAQQEYSLPVDLLILRSISYKDTGTTSYFKLKGLAFSEYNEYIDGFDGSSFHNGVPTHYTVYAGKIILFPIPSTALLNAIKIYYNKSPVDVAAGSDVPELPVLYHESLAKYCLQQAYLLDEDPETAALQGQSLANDLATLRGRDTWKAQERYPTITVLIEDL